MGEKEQEKDKLNKAGAMKINKEDQKNNNKEKSSYLTDFNEEVPHVEGGLGRGLQEDDVVLRCVLLRLLCLHLPLALHISLVSCQSYHHVGVTAALKFLHPRFGAVERILIEHHIR